MSWFYNSYSGELTHASGFNALAYEAVIHTGTGWHQLKIADSATEAQAAAEAVKEVPGGTAPTTSLSKGVQNAVTNNPVTNALGVAGFLSRLANPHTWLRVAEAVVGIAFLIIGLNALLKNPIGKVAGATPAGRAVKMARP